MLGSLLDGNSDGVFIMNVQREGQRPATGLFYGLRGAITWRWVRPISVWNLIGRWHG